MSMWVHSWTIGCPRSIGSLIIVGDLPQKSPRISGSFAKNDLQLRASHGSLPPCRNPEGGCHAKLKKRVLRIPDAPLDCLRRALHSIQSAPHSINRAQYFISKEAYIPSKEPSFQSQKKPTFHQERVYTFENHQNLNIQK